MEANPSEGTAAGANIAVASTVLIATTQGTPQSVLVTCSPQSGSTCTVNGASSASCLPNPTCSVTLSSSASSAGTRTITVNGQGLLTTSTRSSTTFVLTTLSGSSSGTTSSGDRYGFDLALDPSSIDVLKGRSEQFTATVTKRDGESRTCNVQLKAEAHYDRDDLDEYPPEDLTVTLSSSSCTVSPSNPECSVTGTVRTTGNTPPSVYDRFYVTGTCSVGRDREQNERLIINVVPYENEISVSPTSGTVSPGGQTTATVSFFGQAFSRIPFFCSGLPAGVRCDFSGTIPDVLYDTFGSSRSESPTDSYGWISNAEETNAYVSTYGKGGRYDRYMLLAGAPHTSAVVSKSVILPPAAGKRMFISFDYRLQTSWECLTYSYLTSAKTCNYQVYSDGSFNSPDLVAEFDASSTTGRLSQTLTVTGITADERYRSCDDGRYGGETCDIYYNLLDSSGNDVGSVSMEGIVITPASKYFYPREYSRGGLDTGWRTYTGEITNLLSPTQPTVVNMDIENNRWGTRHDGNDQYFIKYHYTSIDNVRIYSDQPIEGCSLSTWDSSSGMYKCSVPVTIVADSTATPGTYNLNFAGSDGYNWFTVFQYGNIYYDWVTGKSQKFMDLSKTVPYELTVSAPCNNDGICALSENQDSCPADCNTKVTVDPKELTAGQTIRVHVDFTDGRYVAGSDVGLTLEIENKLTGVRTQWGAINGCMYGDGTRRTVEQWPEAISQNGRFATTFYCVIPFTIGGGDKSLVVTPVFYP